MRSNVLTRECVALHGYLLGGTPSQYVVEKYTDAHQHLPALSQSRGWFDEFLLGASHLHPFVVRLIQVYARIFAPASLVRKKAVLVLAIVECCAPALVSLQVVRTRSPAHALMLSLLTVAQFVLVLILSSLIFLPIQLASRVAGKSPRTASADAHAVGEAA